MPIYRIHHSTTYRHGTPVTTSWQQLHLQPRNEAAQELLSFELDVSERPPLKTRTDYFGNTVHGFMRQGAAEELVIEATSRVRRSALPPLDKANSPTLHTVQDSVNNVIQEGEFALEQFRHESPAVPFLSQAGALVESLKDSELPVLIWLEKLGTLFAERFAFDPTATSVSTPLALVLEQRRGVCQDFSHLLISCLRQHGIPTSYVSGYLLTRPAPGKPRLQGVDAMHAWISIWVPSTGWVDYDPTNHCFVDTSHVVVARGRDYTDVSPIRGVFRGGPRHALTLGVTMEEEPT